MLCVASMLQVIYGGAVRGGENHLHAHPQLGPAGEHPGAAAPVPGRRRRGPQSQLAAHLEGGALVEQLSSMRRWQYWLDPQLPSKACCLSLTLVRELHDGIERLVAVIIGCLLLGCAAWSCNQCAMS